MKTIYKNMHYCLNFLNFKPFFKLNGLKSLAYKVMFTPSCRYYLKDDQSDINKLFGISLGFHHNNSDRIGWRYLSDTDKIELLLYSYIKGVRYKTSLETIDINQEYIIKLEVITYKKTFRREVRVYINNNIYANLYEDNHNSWGYTLGCYFGGNCKAPHTMKIKIDKL